VFVAEDTDKAAENIAKLLKEIGEAMVDLFAENKALKNNIIDLTNQNKYWRRESRELLIAKKGLEAELSGDAK
jgi:hypothetical protein